tara:strand:- start:413 stop:634 length:222 start_codon:yes stop_codon:yes gene_type:complete
MKRTKFDLPFGYDIINNNETKKDSEGQKDDLEGSYGIHDKNVREETKEDMEVDISSGVVTPSIMHFKICKAKS